MTAEEKLARLGGFIEEWREALETRALVRFEAGPVPADVLTPAARADAFAQAFGFMPIGFNWEMLDPGEDPGAPRSARKTMVEALASDMVDPATRWLGKRLASACAEAFFGAFDPARLDVVTNHLNGLWYPISGARDEWSFAAMDGDAIALLVLVPRA